MLSKVLTHLNTVKTFHSSKETKQQEHEVVTGEMDFHLKMFESRKVHAGRGRERIPSRLHAVSTEPQEGLKLTSWEITT